MTAAVIITVILAVAFTALLARFLWELHRDRTPAPRAPRHAATQPRTDRPGRQPWHTSPMPVPPSPPPQHAYDPGDGAEPPVPLVRPYQARAERGEWGVVPQLEAAEGERLASVYRA